MKLYLSDKVRFILGLILIILIYSFHYLYFVERMGNLLLSKLSIHLIQFSTTLAVYFVGTFSLGKLQDKWMSVLWHFVHFSGLFIITALGLFDWFIAEITNALKQFAYSIQEVLISPAMYFAMGLLNNSLKKPAHKRAGQN